MESLVNLLSDSWHLILAILGFSFIIFVHELGHFLMAKRAGVKVDKFYIGFDFGGLKVFSFIKNETEYGIGIFPFGGYVKLHGYEELPGHETEVKDLPKVHFHAKTVGERFGIMVGGVAMNFISAVFLILIMYGIGKEFAAPIVGHVESVAAMQGGIKVDDKIISINGDPIKTFFDIQKKVVLTKAGESLVIKVERNKVIQELVVKPEMNYEQGMPEIGIFPQQGLGIIGIFDGSPASLAGLLPGDKVESVNEEKIEKYYQFDAEVEKNPGKELDIGVLRQGQLKHLKMKPTPLPSYLMKFETGLKNKSPLEVEMVLPDLAADKAGIKPWDKIVKANDKNIYRVEDLLAILAESNGKEVEIEILRNESSLKLLIAPIFNSVERKFMLGINAAQSSDFGAVDNIEVNGPAYMGGIRAKDKIIKIEGKNIRSISQLSNITKQNFDKTVTVDYVRLENGVSKELQAKITLRAPIRAGFLTRLYRKSQTMISGNKFIFDPYGLGVTFNKEMVLSNPQESTQASIAGFKEGDRLLGISYIIPGENKINTFSKDSIPNGWNSIDMIYSIISSSISINKKGQFIDTQVNPEKLIINIKYERDGKEMETSLSPISATSNKKGFSGVKFGEETILYRYSSIGEAFSLVYSETVGILDFTVSSFSRLISGNYNADALSGPVGMFPVIHRIAKSGFVDLVWLIAMLSINIGFMNFLPFPPLDGGALFFLLIEKIKGSPVSAKFQLRIANAGVMFLIFLMLFVTMNDISKFV